MRPEGFTVFVVEDDSSTRDALALTLGRHGYPLVMFADAESFQQARKPDWTGCLLLDIRLPGIDGLELQARLRDSGCRLPVIVMTGHGNIELARRAFRANAIDFLEKPLDPQRLFGAIAEAQQRQASLREEDSLRDGIAQRLSKLTPREREVMDLVVSGTHNRDIAVRLDISVRTVEVHKARMMDKLGVAGLPQLVRMVMALSRPR